MPKRKDAPVDLAQVMQAIQERDLIQVVDYDCKWSLSLQDWLYLLECMEPTASDSWRIRTALAKIKDVKLLQRYIVSSPKDQQTWAAFKNVILGDFELDVAPDLEHLWDTMSQGDRSVEDYWLHFSGTLRRCKESIPSLLSFGPQYEQKKFRKGLKPYLQTACCARQFNSTQELMQAARFVEQDRAQNSALDVNMSAPSTPPQKQHRRKKTKRSHPPRCRDFQAGNCTYHPCKFAH